MTKIFKLFKELNEELQKRDIASELFDYRANGYEELICFYGEILFSTMNDSGLDKLEMLEHLKFRIEDMIFCCQTALFAIEEVRRKI